jgi:hypothetical protein
MLLVLLGLQISTVNMGLAVGWSAVVLGYGRKGLRKSLPHSLGNPPLQWIIAAQPRVPGQCKHILYGTGVRGSITRHQWLAATAGAAAS